MKSRIDKNYWLFNVAVAHRGLFDENCPENTLPAFENAIKNGYAIETDVHMTTDGVLICYHDNNVKRLCGVDRDIRTMSFSEVQELEILSSGLKIPTFKQVLDFVDGQVPLCIELKQQKNKGLEEKLVELLREYKGEFVIQSFDPFMVRRVQKLEKSFIRGVLTTNEKLPGYPKIVDYLMQRFFFKLFVKFDFLNIRIEDLPFHAKRAKKYNVICWTAKSPNDVQIAKKYAKNVIFEKTAQDLDVFDKKYVK
ncbi:MAG: hypothetical protein IJW26_05600 [Clostridia bacterium]|nr:hypothetical protein [Clostridia bacterium]